MRAVEAGGVAKEGGDGKETYGNGNAKTADVGRASDGKHFRTNAKKYRRFPILRQYARPGTGANSS